MRSFRKYREAGRDDGRYEGLREKCGGNESGLSVSEQPARLWLGLCCVRVTISFGRREAFGLSAASCSCCSEKVGRELPIFGGIGELSLTSFPGLLTEVA